MSFLVATGEAEKPVKMKWGETRLEILRENSERASSRDAAAGFVSECQAGGNRKRNGCAESAL